MLGGLRNSGAKKQGAAGARPVGGACVPLPAASRKALGQGRAATLQSVRLLGLLPQLRGPWSRAATATLQAVQLLSLLLQHMRRKRFQQGTATWLRVLLLGHKRRKRFQLGAASWQLILLLRHKLHGPWVAVARPYGSPTRVPLVPYTMVAACVHQAGGHRGGSGDLVRPAILFGLRSRRACGLG